MSERPTPDLQIVETRVYRGANVWSYDKSIHLVVDLGSLEQFPTNTLPGFSDDLVSMLPGLREHECSRSPGSIETRSSVKPGIVLLGNCSSDPRSTTRWIDLS